MKIRDLQWQDFKPLVENYYALYDEVREDPNVGITLFPDRPSLGSEAEWFASMFRRVEEGAGVAVVAVVDRRAAGLCTVDRRTDRERQHTGILGLLVGRPWRGHGIGRALLQHAVERCRGKFEIVELQVFVTNARARKIYESVGFRSWGILPKAIKRQERYVDLEHMVLDLGST